MPKIYSFVTHAAGDDYVPSPSPGTLVFMANDGPGTVLRDNITIVDDSLLEMDEDFLLSASLADPADPAQFISGRDTAVALILNDEGMLYGTPYLQ